ncbi:MAG: oligopeptide/dipeptide ABC transporter ATP-binding protein, partial [Nocardioidaceae bacterium]
ALVDDGVRQNDTALLFITHDLAVVATLTERVLVMYGGRVVETGPTRDVLTRPRHPYTRGLLHAADLDAAGHGVDLPTIPGTVPAAGHFPTGCVFRNRCDRSSEHCVQTPPWSGVAAAGYACFHPVEES